MAVRQLLNDSSRRRDMRAAGLMTMDGLGADRIAKDLVGLLATSRRKMDTDLVA
jgi:spore coat polysaccharide biosynthesis protein SpsF